jgi:hypothetical protein
MKSIAKVSRKEAKERKGHEENVIIILYFSFPWRPLRDLP